MDESRIIVTGGSGQLGTAFGELIPSAVFPSSDELDLSRLDEISETLQDLNPSAVINCAAYTNVDGAESDEAHALAVNGDAVGILARTCADLDIPFLTFSTDYVFNGLSDTAYLEGDATDPINAYGRSKLEGEQQALAVGGRTLVIRTSWVVSATHDNFVSTMIRLATEADTPLRVVADQRGRPTIATDLAAGAWLALSKGATGILHMVNDETATWFEFASAILDLAEMDNVAIEPCETSEYLRAAERPANSVLESTRLASFDLTPLPSWRVSLPEVVRSQMRRVELLT